MKPLAVVLASGGMDSTVTAAIANQNYRLAFLHVQYGQRTQSREFLAYRQIADHYGVKDRLVTPLDHLARIGGSSLTDQNIAVSQADLEATGIPSSYVPFRNAHLLSIATSWAEVLGAERIFIGAVQEDSSGYPDCRLSFIEAFNKVIELGSKPESRIQIEAPLIHMSKREIVAKGVALAAPLEKSWSCYAATEKACGVCDSCALRLRGFALAGVRDPITYQDDRVRSLY